MTTLCDLAVNLPDFDLEPFPIRWAHLTIKKRLKIQ
jgi:hypothetical protein